VSEREREREREREKERERERESKREIAFLEKEENKGADFVVAAKSEAAVMW
jgi:hypothetical protein